MSLFELHLGDCLEVMRGMADNSVDAVVTDPPYFKVKRDWWDRQWDTPSGFLAWLDSLAEQWQRILKPSGSLYCFASPKMAARVEVLLGERFNVVNRITWAKPCPFSEINKGASNSGRIGKDSLRSFYPNTEAIIFCEHYGADNIAKGEAGYGAKCDELRGFVFEPLRTYLDGERVRAGFTPEDCNEACGHRRNGGMAGRHYFSSSQWCLPTRSNYEKLREAFNERGRKPSLPYQDFHQAPRSRFERDLRADYEYLRADYEDLRADYEDLRREYEDLRRPFAVTADVPYTDVWTFPTVQYYPGKHPCEKPAAMLEHIISASTRSGAVVLDCFAGSGSTLAAAKKLGRYPIGIEIDPHWHGVALSRLGETQQATTQAYAPAKPKRPDTGQLSLFDTL